MNKKAEPTRIADFDQELDTTGLNCPLPILRTKKTLAGMAAGETLHVISTDSGAVRDFEAFCRQTGDELLEAGKKEGKFHFLIKKT